MRTRCGLHPGFWLVFWRELGWLRRRPSLVVLVTALPLALMAVMIAIFGAGLATRLPIAVLDLDGSDLARQIIEERNETLSTCPISPTSARSRRGL